MLATVAAALLVPVAGLAGGSGRDGAAVPDRLLKKATANPSAVFDVIVQGETGRTSSTIASDVTSANGRSKRQFLSINGVSASISGGDLLKLAKDSHVAAIVPDDTFATAGYVNNEIWRLSTGISSLAGSLLSLGSPAPTIAIVDSGIDTSKVGDFGGRVVATANFVSSEPGVTGDPDGHGTMVAGLAAGGGAPYTGVATNAKLADVRVADSRGQASTSDILAGVDWIMKNKSRLNIRVANFSLSGRPGTTILYDPVDQAVEKLWLNGVVVVAAAGNNGDPSNPVAIGAPANDPFVITVGANDAKGTSQTGDDFRAPWSAYGYTADGFVKPELSAPGRYMVAPVPMGSYLVSMKPDRVLAPGYMWMSGTSFSAPVVAGAAAQLIARHPDWTPDMVKGALMAGTKRLTGSGSTGTGVGELNLANALNITTAPNPNSGLARFVAQDSATGLMYFNASNWVSTVSTSSNWVSSNWVSSNWVDGLWSASNWVSSNWVESNWVESNWVESNWVESNWVESNWVE